MRIEFIILTCEKYHNTRVESIRNTWGKKQKLTFLSDMNIGNDIAGFEYLKKGYENIWQKYFEYIKNLKELKSDWYFLTDDDTFVNMDNIEKLISNYNTNDKIALGHIGRLNIDGTDMDGNQTGFPLSSIIGDDSYLPIDYFSGGAGFILSRSAMLSLIDYLNTKSFENITRTYNGDVTIGFWLRNSGIKIEDIFGFWWTNPEDLRHNNDQIKSSYTYHYVDCDKMDKLYNQTKEFKKSDTSFTIVTQIRNEEKRLKDWILYHKNIGIDEFIIYLDNCDDQSRNILEELSKSIEIKIFNANMFGSYPPTNNASTYSGYSVVMRIIDSLKRGLYEVRNSNKNDNHWTIFTEVDEYIIPQNEKNLKEIVETVDENRIYIASYDFMCPFDLNYPVYNQTYLRWSDNTRDTGRDGYFKNRGKSLVRTNFVLSEEVDIHDVDYSKYWQNNNLLKINHYRNNGEMQIYDYEDKKIVEWL